MHSNRSNIASLLTMVCAVLFGMEGSGMMIGNTGAFVGVASRFSARSYVQDGLVAMWDGIENAGLGVHDESATTWKDLSGNGHDMVVQAGMSFPEVLDSAMLFDSGMAIVATPGYSPNGTYLPATVEICYETALFTNNNCFITVGQSGSGNGYDSARYWSNQIRCTVSNFNETSGVGTFAYTRTKTTSGILSAFFNAQLKGTTRIWKLLCCEVYLGYAPESRYIFNGKVHRCSIYNRALTAAEIAANYAVDKARFNLP